MCCSILFSRWGSSSLTLGYICNVNYACMHTDTLHALFTTHTYLKKDVQRELRVLSVPRCIASVLCSNNLLWASMDLTLPGMTWTCVKSLCLSQLSTPLFTFPPSQDIHWSIRPSLLSFTLTVHMQGLYFFVGLAWDSADDWVTFSRATNAWAVWCNFGFSFSSCLILFMVRSVVSGQLLICGQPGLQSVTGPAALPDRQTSLYSINAMIDGTGKWYVSFCKPDSKASEVYFWKMKMNKMSPALSCWVSVIWERTGEWSAMKKGEKGPKTQHLEADRQRSD